MTPRSGHEEIVGFREDGVLLVRVTAAPHDGEANEAVVRLLAKKLGVAKRAVRIQGGAASRDKWIDLDGLDDAELRRRLGRSDA